MNQLCGRSLHGDEMGSDVCAVESHYGGCGTVVWLAGVVFVLTCWATTEATDETTVFVVIQLPAWTTSCHYYG